MANKIFKGLLLIATHSLLHRSVRKLRSSSALPVRGLGCVQAPPAAAESITMQVIKITVRLSLCISDLSFLCFRVRIAPVLL